MHSFTFSNFVVVITAIFAVIQALPITSPANIIKARDYIGDECGDSSFINGSSLGSPKIKDCMQIATDMSRRTPEYNSWGGKLYPPVPLYATQYYFWFEIARWHLAGRGKQQRMTSYQSCTIGATSFEDGGSYIGSKDVLDLINSSIKRFSWNGRVGASGNMLCNGPKVYDGKVNWGIYHTWFYRDVVGILRWE